MAYSRYLTMANKPRIRFKGFTEDWEQRKLDDIAKIKTGGGTPKTANPEYWSGNIPWIQSSDLVEGDIAHVNINKFINNNALKNSAAKLISRDSIALVTRVGVGKVAVINQDFTTSQDFLSLSDFDRSDIKFLAYQLYRLMQENAKVLQGTSIKGITKTELIEQSISIPSSGQEQHLISNVLSKIDSIITLHQCKLEKLKLTKKALLQKLFPKNGKHIPEIRFKGFTDAWEQCKFGELFEYERPDAYIVKSDNYNDVFNMPVLTANKAFILGYTNEENSYNKPSIIFDDFTLDKKYVDFPYMLKSSAIKILTSKNQHNLRFLFERLNSTRFEVLGHARHYISIVQNTSTLCPSIEEEFCISNLLTRFDEIITLHQRKLERLQEVKKGLLQKMFV